MSTQQQSDQAVEIVAIRLMLLAMINTHPNRDGLVHQLDSIAASLTAHKGADRDAAAVPDRVVTSLQRFRKQIMERPVLTSGGGPGAG